MSLTKVINNLLATPPSDATVLTQSTINALATDSVFTFRNYDASGITLYTITSNLTIPAEIPVFVEPGAIISVNAGCTLTSYSDFNAGNSLVFIGDGNVVLSGGVIKPEWFGAIDEDGEDNSAAFNKALSSIPSNKSAILQCNGTTYGFNTVVNVPDNVLVEGNGKGLTTFVALSSISGEIMFKVLRNSAKNIFFKNITFDLGGFSIQAISMNYSTSGRLSNIGFKFVNFINGAGSFTFAVRVQNADYIVVENSNFGTGGCGARFSSCNVINLDKSCFENNYYGLYFDKCTQFNVAHGYFKLNSKYGLYVDYNSDTKNFKLHDSYFGYNSLDAGWNDCAAYVLGSNLHIHDNVFEFNYKGLVSNGCSEVSIHHNKFIKNAIDGGNIYGDRITFKDNEIISNNTSNTAGVSGVKLFASGTNTCYVEDNVGYNETGVGYQEYAISINGFMNGYCKTNYVPNGGVLGGIEGMFNHEAMLNVLHYTSMKLDGITDDSTALTQLTSVLSSNSILFFPSGTCKISNNVSIGNPIVLSNARFSVDTGKTFATSSSITVLGRLYTINGGAGILKSLPIEGYPYSTAQRNGTHCSFQPGAIGTMVFDTTLNKPVWLTAITPTWRDATGSAV